MVAVGAVMAISALGAPAPKVGVCHLQGNGVYNLINVSGNAVAAHVAHGDSLAGAVLEEHVVVGDPVEGTPYAGLYGSTVTPITTTTTTTTTSLGTDCTASTSSSETTSTVLKVAHSQSYAVGGWAGWSCIEPGYPNAVGGGVTDGIAAAEGIAEPGAPPIGGYNYPVYPHYTFPGGEEGYVVQAGDPVPTEIFVICAPAV